MEALCGLYLELGQEAYRCLETLGAEADWRLVDVVDALVVALDATTGELAALCHRIDRHVGVDA